MPKSLSHPSLFYRLVLRILILVAVLVLVVLTTFYISLHTTVDSLRDRGLHGQAQDIAAHLRVDSSGQIILQLPPSLADDYSSSRGEYVYVVMNEDGEVLAASDDYQTPLNKLRDEVFKTYDPERNHDFYGATIRQKINGHTYYVQVGQGPKHDDVLLDTLIEELGEEWAWVLVLFIAGVMGVIAITIRTSLKPVIRASAEAQNISPQNTDIRISEQRLPKEILPLVQGMNAALDRLEEGFRQQREFTANAAHELRTPLSVLKANLDNLKERDVANQLSDDVDRMSRLVSQLLRVAQLESFVLDINDNVDLKDVATEVASYLAPLALKDHKSIELKAGDKNIVKGNREALIHAVRNLVENGLQHTAKNTTVCIDVSDPGKLTVTDEGPGIPAEHHTQIFQRFWRDSNKGKRTGSGLGLSIASAIMEQHNGRVAVDNPATGGAAFHLIFPQKS